MDVRATLKIKALAKVRALARTRRRIGAQSAAVAAVLLATVVVPIPAHAAETYPVPVDRVFHLEGRGYGHGRGLSQWGSNGAASQGVPWQQIIAAYYPGTALTDAGNPPIRVRLTRTTGQAVVVRGALVALDDLGRGTSLALPSGTVRCDTHVRGSGMVVTCLTGSRWTDIGEFSRVQLRGNGLLFVDRPGGYRNGYRGAIQVARYLGNVVGVAVMSTEEYLYGVVPSESPSTWPLDALRAQAVAARTYADWLRRTTTATAWDICDTTACQLFNGTRSVSPSGVAKDEEDTRTTQAVNDTAGQELFYQGAPILAEFSASNGGFSTTRDPGRPYFVARSDPWDGALPNRAHAWTAALPASALEARWPQVGRLARLVVVSRDGNGEWGGRVVTVRLEGLDARGLPTAVQVAAEDVRRAYPWDGTRPGLKSRWFRVVDQSSIAP